MLGKIGATIYDVALVMHFGNINIMSCRVYSW